MTAKCVMVYTSMTGNTELMANAIAEGVKEAGCELDIKDVFQTSASDLEKYDGILLGSYTWGDGELPDEFLDFYEEMEELDLNGKKAAVFGSYDSVYDNYGAALTLLTEKLNELGAEMVLDSLKVELTPTDEDKSKCKAFGKSFVAKVLN